MSKRLSITAQKVWKAKEPGLLNLVDHRIQNAKQIHDKRILVVKQLRRQIKKYGKNLETSKGIQSSIADIANQLEKTANVQVQSALKEKIGLQRKMLAEIDTKNEILAWRSQYALEWLDNVGLALQERDVPGAKSFIEQFNRTISRMQEESPNQPAKPKPISNDRRLSLVEKILSLNDLLQGYMETKSLKTLTGDEASKIVHEARIVLHSGPPGARYRFGVKDFFHLVRTEYGHERLNALLGVTQTRNRSNGRYSIRRIDLLTKEMVDRILGGEPKMPPGTFLKSLPDYLKEGLDVVFVGTSVSQKSAKQGHYYADPHNRFWDLVNQAGLVSDLVGAENDYLILDEKCGLTDLAKRKVSSYVTNLGTMDFDVRGFIKKIESFRPTIVAFNGKRAYKAVFKKDAKDYGLADDILGGSCVFVLPSCSGTDTSMSFKRKLQWFKKLKVTLDNL